MTTMTSTRRSSFGMRCVHCDNELIAPQWTEHRSERLIERILVLTVVAQAMYWFGLPTYLTALHVYALIH
jgi:hypothetical protein